MLSQKDEQQKKGADKIFNSTPTKPNRSHLKQAKAEKVRVKLPPIESYSKEIEFPAEGPGRVLVRLERLMGSDRVKLTDPKWFQMLLAKLEEEEHKAWIRRSKQRKKAEKDRSRKLAIDGLMDPTEDMLDLVAHPVFRVNRVLQKLSMFDSSMGVGVKDIGIPPIMSVEPFQFDGSGSVFKSYPRHTELKNESDKKKRQEENSRQNVKSTSEIAINGWTGDAGPSEFSKVAVRREHKEEDDDHVEPSEGHDEEEGDSHLNAIREHRKGKISPVSSHQSKSLKSAVSNLMDLHNKYPLHVEENLFEWEPFKSHLIDLLDLEDLGSYEQFYQAAEEIVGVYQRENLATDEFMMKLGKMMNNGGGIIKD